MFRKTRIKIVAAIMSILVVLFLGTLAVIFVSSYASVSKSNYQMLQKHADLFLLDGQGSRPPMQFDPNIKDDKPFDDNHAFRVSTFYSVAVGQNGEILSVDDSDSAVYEEETLVRFAQEILSGTKGQGVKEGLLFLVTRRDGFTLVTFMDNTILQRSMTTLFRYTLVFGSLSLVALFFLAVYLAKRIVGPLEESYWKQKRFISDAGHELKTPVSVVSANAELLSRQIGKNQWLSNIQYENERMGNLVCQLLELARTEDVVPQTQILDFSRLVEGGVLPFEGVAFEKGLTIDSHIAEGIFVNGNSDQLRQLVSILVDNAIRYGQSGKKIGVTLTENRTHAIFTVVNDSDPIPQEQVEKLFERFYRVDEARTGGEHHYGLGLSIAQAIVQAHHGQIQVSSRGREVCFTVKLPK